MVGDARFPATGMPDRDWWQALWPDPERVLRDAGAGAGRAVVDLCCGDGYFTAPMCALAAPARVWGVDLDPDLLAAARTACAAHANFIPVAGDARDLPALIGTAVDLVFIANTFHGVPDQPLLAAAVHETLAPGGRFAIVNWHALARERTRVLGKPRGPATELRMDPESVRRQVEPAGFRLEAVHDAGPFHYTSVFRRQ